MGRFYDAQVRHHLYWMTHMCVIRLFLCITWYVRTSCDTKKQSDDAHVRHHLYWMTHLCVIKSPHDALGRHKFHKNVIITELSRIARGLGIELGKEGVKMSVIIFTPEIPSYV